MLIAEEEISTALKKVPRNERTISFLALMPTDGMSSLASEVYRSHCRELIQRQLTGEPLEPGTLAEVLILMSHTSLKAPLDQLGGAVAEYAFQEVFGRTLDGEPLREPWPGAVAEQIAVLRRKLRRNRNRPA